MKIKGTGMVMMVIITMQLQAVAAPPEEGRSIFMARCAACHTVNKILTGPALSGVEQRRNIEWIINFVHSSQTMIKSGDSTALALFEKFNRVVMPDHADLTVDNIKSLVEYIKSESKMAGTNTAPFVKPSKQQKYYLPVNANDYAFFGGYIALVLLLAGILYYAVQVKTFQRNKVADNSSV